MLDAATEQAGRAGQLEGQPGGVRLQRVILDRPVPLRDLILAPAGHARNRGKTPGERVFQAG